jgi:hypothetical protein
MSLGFYILSVSLVLRYVFTLEAKNCLFESLALKVLQVKYLAVSQY